MPNFGQRWTRGELRRAVAYVQRGFPYATGLQLRRFVRALLSERYRNGTAAMDANAEQN